MEKKIITFETKRIIDFIQIEEDIYAYREERIIGDEDSLFYEGVSLLEDIENVGLSKGIARSKYNLSKEEILEFLRKNIFSDHYNELDSFIIENPYTYIQENGLEGTKLIEMSFSNHNIYDIKQNKFPKAIYFDYIRARVNNGNYNLEGFLEKISGREDIELISEGIVEIPYYNASEEENKQLEFIWIPSDEDFDKVKDLEGTFKFHNFVIENIFGVKQLEGKGW